MDKFIERLNAVKDLFATSLEFQKLEKVEVGGIRARWLSPRIESIFGEFEELYSFFSGVPYDPLDPDDDSFEKDYTMFRNRIRDFDNRMAAICSQAFDDCVNTESILKYISMMGTLLDREAIKAAVEPKLHRLYDLLHSEHDTVKAMFDRDLKCYKEKGEIQIDDNFPPVSGTIMKIIMLRARIAPDIVTLKGLDHPLAETEEANYIYKKHDEMLSYLERFERLIFRKWATQVPRICKENLEKTLMIRCPDMSLILNFDQELTTLLSEIRYLNMMGVQNLPQEAVDIYARNEELRSWIFELNATMAWYNEIRRISTPIEFEIISDEVEEIDFLIQEALDTLNWNSFMVSVYLEKMHDMIKCLNDRLKMAQANIQFIISMIEPWTQIPLYDRKDGRKEALIFLEDRHDRLEKRYNEIKRAGITIHEIMVKNYNLFFNIVPEEEKVEEEEQEEEEEEEGMEGEEGMPFEEVAPTEVAEAPDAHEDEEGDEPKRKKSKKMVEEPIEKDVGIELLGVKTGAKVKKLEPEWKLEEFEFDDEDKPPEVEEPVIEIKPAKEKTSKGELKKKKRKTVEEPPPGKKKPGGRQRPPPEPEPEPEPEEVEEEEELELTESELYLQQRRAEKWEPYIEFVDELVFEGLQSTLVCSISLFVDQMDPDSGAAPLFTVALVLKEPELLFVPSLDTEDPEGFYKLVQNLIRDIMRMSFLVERVSKNPEKLRYKHELETNEELVEMRQELLCHVQLGMEEAIDYCKRFQEYAHLWSDDRQQFLQQFITYGHALNAEEQYLLDAGMEDHPSLQKNPPTLPKFKEQVCIIE